MVSRRKFFSLAAIAPVVSIGIVSPLVIRVVDERPTFKLADFVLVSPNGNGECLKCGSIHFVQLDNGEVVYPYTKCCAAVAWPKEVVARLFDVGNVSIYPAITNSVPYEWSCRGMDGVVVGEHTHEDFRWV